MKVMKARGSFTGSAGGSPPRRRRRRWASSGATTSAVALAMARSTFLPFPLPFARSAAASRPVAASATGSLPLRRLASLTASRLLGPLTGVRGVKIHPTPGTGLPPTNRPLSNSHSCSPWNSWKESLDRTVAPVFSAMRSRNASPRPMAPAGGETTSPASSAASNAATSEGSMR